MGIQKSKQRREKEPLFRKVNTRTHNVKHGNGGEYRWDRRTKSSKHSNNSKSGMTAQQNGLDYTPLFRFLLSRVGRDWSEVYSEALSRLNSSDPISWMVANDEAEKQSFVRIGESSYFSGLFVDSDNILRVVDTNLTNEDFFPWCKCCTHTFNGKAFLNKFDPDKRGLEYE